jgi:hypothetical protein
MGLVMEVRRGRLKMFVIFAFVVAAAYACNLLAESGIAAGKAWFASWIFIILAVFTLGAAIFSKSLVARVSPEGLLAPSICKDLIPWSDIQSISVVNAYGSDSAQVNLVPGSKSEQAVSRLAATLSKIGKAQGIEGYSIALGTTGISGDTFATAVRNAESRASRRPNSGRRLSTGGASADAQQGYGRRG